MKTQSSQRQSFGDVLRERQLADATLTEYSYRPRTEIANHLHALSYFNLILEGTYDETHAGKVRVCKPAMLFFHPAGEVHANRFRDTRSRVFRCEIGTRWSERARQHSVMLNRPITLTSGQAVWLASRLYRELYATDSASSLVVEGLLLEIVAEASRDKPIAKSHKPPQWLQSANELIHANFSEPMSVSYLANTVGVHPIHLSRQFRKYYGQSIGEYVRQLRIKFACRQITETETSLMEIGAAAGFADQAHFSRTFKRITGLIPSHYRSGFQAR